MTLDKDRKRIIRKRMSATGESYTTARRQVLAKAAGGGRAARTEVPAAPARIDAKLAGQSDATIRKQTGRSWAEWIRLLDAAGARTMTHTQIARLVQKEHGVQPWWTQAVTVGYERLTGRREVGQRSSGHYEVSKSKTVAATAATVFEAWADDKARRTWLQDAKTTVRTAKAPKSIRLQWPDGTIVAVWIEAKGRDRSVVSVAHTKLASRAAMEVVKAEWSSRLDALSRFLDRRAD